MPESETPITAVDKAAKAAMEVIEFQLGKVGADARHVFIIIDATGQPEGEPNATVAGHGYEDARDLLAELLLHAHEIGQGIGVRVDVLDTTAKPPGFG